LYSPLNVALGGYAGAPDDRHVVTERLIGDTASVEPTADDVTHREAVRVILIDPAERVLLIGGRDPDDQRIVWIMPGGGIEEGESVKDAGARELFEETGIALKASALLGPVWKRQHRFSWDGQLFDYREWFVVARLTAPAVVKPFASEEARHLIGMRWVTVAELSDWPDLLAPRRLSELLPPILAGELPSEPIETGV